MLINFVWQGYYRSSILDGNLTLNGLSFGKVIWYLINAVLDQAQVVEVPLVGLQPFNLLLVQILCSPPD